MEIWKAEVIPVILYLYQSQRLAHLHAYFLSSTEEASLSSTLFSVVPPADFFRKQHEISEIRLIKDTGAASKVHY